MEYVHCTRFNLRAIRRGGGPHIEITFKVWGSDFFFLFSLFIRHAVILPLPPLSPTFLIKNYNVFLEKGSDHLLVTLYTLSFYPFAVHNLLIRACIYHNFENLIWNSTRFEKR